MKQLCLAILAAACATASIALLGLPVRAETTRLAELSARADLEKPFETGYELGYDLGFAQGAQMRAQAQAYAPSVDAESLKTIRIDHRLRAGYQAGFFAGYQDGYYNSVSSDALSTNHFNTGYTDGYRAGINDGNLCRQHQSSYNPVPAIGEQTPPEYRSGYRVGYWQGFEAGYTYWEL